MRKNKRLLLIFLFIIALGFFAINNISAQILPTSTPQQAPLEVVYPSIPGQTAAPGTVGATTTLPTYIEYIFDFLVWGSGILALLALILGGFDYIASVGNPDKLRNAKDKIISALLGLAIVVGSWVILWQINPQFLAFNLPPLKPMISSVQPGVWLCKTDTNNDIMTAWTLGKIYELDRIEPTLIQPNFLNSIVNLLLQKGIVLTNISNTNDMVVRRQIRDEINILLERIGDDCYRVETAGEIKKDFNNRNLKVWFVPDLTVSTSSSGQKTMWLAAKYGAAIFDNDDYTGLGNLYMGHFFFIGSARYLDYFTLREQDHDIRVSSIRPFRYDYSYRLNPTLNPLWTVDLFEQKSFNDGFVDPNNPQANAPPYASWNSAPLSPGSYIGHINPSSIDKMIPLPITPNPPVIPPRSLKLSGNVMVALYKDSVTTDSSGNLIAAPEISKTNTAGQTQTGRYLQIFFQDDNNLEDDYTLVNWNRCPNQKASAQVLQHCTVTAFVWVTTPFGGTQQLQTAPDCCAEADADGIVILSSVTPL